MWSSVRGKAAALGLKAILELHRQDGGRNPDQLAAMIQVKLGRNHAQQLLTFHRQWIAGQINCLVALKPSVTLCSRLISWPANSGSKFSKHTEKVQKRKSPLPLNAPSFELVGAVKNQDIPRQKPVGDRF